jgi:hypothetical protein
MVIFRVYDRITFEEIEPRRVRMGADGEFYIDGSDLPVDRLRYFIQFNDSVVLGDGDFKAFSQILATDAAMKSEN